MKKPSVGIFGLTGCAGDQLVILNAEDELLDIVHLLDVKDFLMASSDNDTRADLDVAFVEGAVVSARDEAVLREIRRRSRLLVAIGTCAVWGGIPAMDRAVNRDALLHTVYGVDGRDFDATPTRALREVVKVDGAITGCPIEKDEVVAAIASLVNGDLPLPVTTPVCAECKMRETVCLLVHGSLPCLGAVTAGGCHARCPALGIPCVGCRGPAVDANVESALAMFAERGFSPADLAAKLSTFAPPLDIPAATGGRRS